MRYSEMNDEQLLTALDEERQKFTKSDKQMMGGMIAELQRRGVYPAETVEGNPNTVEVMVLCWGARWHQWRGLQTCPHCAADLRDHRVGPPFSRKVGLYGRDRTYAYQCPDCQVEWSREHDDRGADPTRMGE